METLVVVPYLLASDPPERKWPTYRAGRRHDSEVRHEAPRILHPRWGPGVNPGVGLARAYLELNGYFTQFEVPVIRGEGGGSYKEITDLDLLGLRFPHARVVVPHGSPDGKSDLPLAEDDLLDLPSTRVDVIISEVKEGTPRLNESMRSEEVLGAALRRVGCCPANALGRVVKDLQREGRAHLRARESGIPCRIRLVAFGDGTSGQRNGYSVISLRHVAHFVQDYLDRYHPILNPAAMGDPVLGLLHLLRKLG